MPKKSTSRKELAKIIYEVIGFSKIISENMVNDIFNIISVKLQKNDKVKISAFGTFFKKKKDKRLGRNPKTKEEKTISSRNVITFKASQLFKKKINL